MNPSVGFYVHYHGRGHKHRTEAILRHLTLPATVITSRLENDDWLGPTLSSVVGISCDIDDVPAAGLEHAEDVPALHYAPLWTGSITQRVAQYAAWLNAQRPSVMIIDVSAEISMLTRLASIPQIVMRQHGRRDDTGHLGAYAAAHSLLAPFPESMEDDITPDWVREKTVYLDGFCRGSTHDFDPATTKNRVVVMFGRGGSDATNQSLREAAKSLPDHQWIVIGKSDDEGRARTPGNLTFVGWVEDPSQLLRSAEVVVTAAGHNSVMELGSLRRRFIAIAQDRPFEEQLRKVVVLQREQLAVGLRRWPCSSEWPRMIEQAKKLDTSRWRKMFQRDGAQQAAAHIEKVARWSHLHRQVAEETPCQLAS